MFLKKFIRVTMVAINFPSFRCRVHDADIVSSVGVGIG